MRRNPDPVLEADLVAYVDGQLGAARRIEVEAHLAQSPSEAVRVMADLRDRDELRMAMSEISTRNFASPRTTQAAWRLERALRRQRFVKTLRRVAAVGLFVTAGWLAHAGIGPLGVRESVASAPPPAFVEDAFQAHRTAELRAGMHSQPGVRAYDAAEIRSATAIDMPALPKRWQVDDVQIFPSPFGPSVEIAAEAPDFGALSLFAVRPGRFDVAKPRIAGDGEVTAVYWQVGDVAYALVGRTERREKLEEQAESLARTLY